jgi:hypothetical protein
MTKPLDVLIIESQPGVAAGATAALERRGHHVHRCYSQLTSFPCRGVTDSGSCPVDLPVDVALVVRPRVSPHPTPFESGVACAIRAGVPIVEDGPQMLDPFEPWVAARVRPDDDIADVCIRTAEDAWQPLCAAVHRHVRALLLAADVSPDELDVWVQRDGMQLVVHLDAPAPVTRGLRHALGVRVLDAVRSLGRTYGSVDVVVASRPPAGVGSS